METQNFRLDPRIRRVVACENGVDAPVVRSLRDRIRVESASSLARFRRNRTTGEAVVASLVKTAWRRP